LEDEVSQELYLSGFYANNFDAVLIKQTIKSAAGNVREACGFGNIAAGFLQVP
jgi:hypothetical protein